MGEGEQVGLTTEMHEFPDHTTYSFTTPIKDPELDPEPYYTSFSFGFKEGDLDNVTVTGIPYEPPATEFLGHSACIGCGRFFA